MRGTIASFIAGLLLLGGGLLLVGAPSLGAPGQPDSPPSGGPSEPPPPPTACQPAKAVASELLAQGFAPGEYLIGQHVNWRNNPVDNTGGAFGGRLETRQELSTFLRADAPQSRAARRIVLRSIPDGERARALSGRGYLPVQFRVPVDYTGNLQWNGTRPITPNGVKRAKKGDVAWVYVTRGCDVLWAPSVRADCGNISYRQLVPVREP